MTSPTPDPAGPPPEPGPEAPAAQASPPPQVATADLAWPAAAAAPPPGYAQPHPYPYAYPPPRPTSTIAILALVFGFLLPPAGIILGHVARRQLRERGEEGDGLALAGLVIGYVQTGLVALFCFGYVAFVILFIAIQTSTVW